MTRRSHWLGEALAEDDEQAPQLHGIERADVCIVGGGFTGLWTAIRLKERDPALDVVIVEKDFCGAGASGRNGGFVLSWWAKFLSLQKICGEAEALRLGQASADAVAEIGDFCRQNHIDCHYRRDGWLWAATNEAQVGAWRSTVDAIGRFQRSPFEAWSPDDVARRSGSPMHLAGIFEPTAASVQPALLARGLRRVALARGVRIHEQTPLTRLVRSFRPQVVTPTGRVQAETIVLAMNAWGIRFAALRQAVVVGTSDIVATAPSPERLKEIGWGDGMTISDGRMLVHYYRTTRDGRIAFGKGGFAGPMPFAGRVGAKFDGPSRHPSAIADWLRWTYPILADVPIEASWTGPIDRSKSGLPLFGRLDGDPRILYAIGYSGNGVGPSALGGRILASLALGLKDEWSESGLVRPPRRDFPPEPIRAIGARLVRRAAVAKDRAEDSGRRPGRLVTYLAGFAPAGLSPFKGQKSGLAPPEPAGPDP
jgi:putative aminophosphonate oxidoreductase